MKPDLVLHAQRSLGPVVYADRELWGTRRRMVWLFGRRVLMWGVRPVPPRLHAHRVGRSRVMAHPMTRAEWVFALRWAESDREWLGLLVEWNRRSNS